MKVDGVTVASWHLAPNRIRYETREIMLAFFRALTAITPAVKPWSDMTVLKAYAKAPPDRSRPLFWLEAFNNVGPVRRAHAGLMGKRIVEDPPSVFTTYATVGAVHRVNGTFGVSATNDAGGEDGVLKIVDELESLFTPLTPFSSGFTGLLYTQFAVDDIWNGATLVSLTEARLDLLGFELGRDTTFIEATRASFREGLSEPVYEWVGNIAMNIAVAKVQPVALV